MLQSKSLILSVFILVISILLMVIFGIFNRKMNRKYIDSDTIKQEYNNWTQDGILEYYWGHHIHLGYYPNGIANNIDFRKAKQEMTFKLFEWAHSVTNRDINDNNMQNMILLDAGCGFGGSTISITKKYKIRKSIGITLSDYQVKRAKEILTSYHDLDVDFKIGDATNMSSFIKNQSIDIIWSLEMEPHIPDKNVMIDEFLRILKPNGILILGCWNIRKHDTKELQLNKNEKELVWFLKNEWGHPNFWSISKYKSVFAHRNDIDFVMSDNWSKYTLPSWYESIYEMIRRPKMLVWCLLHPSSWNDRFGDLIGLINMEKAFRTGLMEYGVFAVVKK